MAAFIPPVGVAAAAAGLVGRFAGGVANRVFESDRPISLANGNKINPKLKVTIYKKQGANDEIMLAVLNNQEKIIHELEQQIKNSRDERNLFVIIGTIILGYIIYYLLSKHI